MTDPQGTPPQEPEPERPTESTPDSTPSPEPTGGPPPPAPSTGEGGLDPKIGAMLSYLLFGWVGGLIMFFTQKHPEVRFHAAQSILVFGAFTVVNWALSWMLPFALSALLTGLLGIAAFVLWILLSIKGYQLEHIKMPIAGDIAEKWAAS
jgi:uncharacterized membrane protein